ncbi:SMP-30/gluconolactonase/LRE family protein [Acidovorax sp. Leaf78]|uniref:SMP-30/gluconolactonase/LRE family protein n=1 Tax=Acidovorax sp. Leaf78 TaxID=1736237 RepID=UPI0006FF74A2|nr:SMP-30/gluconolactonase/LRE family protein [Acidovorax sp. Leaf78]KQO27513.1 strictosidine synthase [Acidovorax sp. Leaf78]
MAKRTLARTLGWGVGGAVLAAAAYLAWWPVPIRPVAWTAPAAPGYQGVHAPNQRLAGLRMIDLKGEVGPEHIALGKDGKLYTTVLSGNILRMNPDGSGQEVFANTGGRVLGFDFDAAGNLIAADAVKGLLSIAPDGKVTVLADKVGNDPIRYADGVVVAKSGKMYLSDASTRFAPKDWGGTFEASVLDILEQASTGRVLEYDPATRATRVVARGISFANGVALSQDGQSLFVNETGKYRVWKIAVDANDLDISEADAKVKAPAGSQPAPQARVLLDNLPGYPDNLMRGMDGRIWLGFAKPRGAAIDNMAGKPWLRSLTLRLPRALWPIPKPYGHVIAFTDDGKVVADLQDPTGAYPETTAITETADRLYVQSLHAHRLGWLPKDVLQPK